jgi:hypothetical protein
VRRVIPAHRVSRERKEIREIKDYRESADSPVNVVSRDLRVNVVLLDHRESVEWQDLLA